jgi:predicted ATPase
MEGKRTIEKIRLRNILSFGDKGEEIELQPLNVLIGQNASGKSNFIDIFKLLRSLPQDKGLANFISKSGGISEWIWKGQKSKKPDFSEIEVNLPAKITLVSKDKLQKSIAKDVTYKIRLKESAQRLAILDEEIYRNNKSLRLIISRYKNFPEESLLSSFMSVIESDQFRGEKRNQPSNILFFYLRQRFLHINIFDNFQTNRSSEIRTPQIPDAPNDFLEEDGSNLALVLNDLEHGGDTKDKIVFYLKKFNPRIKDYSIRILGGTVQLFVREEGLEKPISAMRLSDGTLRYLCLLAILCHPEPPPLICLEEPEVGLHPDILPTIAELLIDASSRTQLIVTTHSDILVSALSDVPEAVLVCEADEDGTHFKRLDKENLKEWLDEYSLGEVWLRGGIGGTRW